MAHDAIPDRDALRARAERGHAARKFACRRERERRLDLIFALDDQRIEEIERGVGDFDDRLALARVGFGRVSEAQHLGRTKRFANQGFHRRLEFYSFFINLRQVYSVWPPAEKPADGISPSSRCNAGRGRAANADSDRGRKKVHAFADAFAVRWLAARRPRVSPRGGRRRKPPRRRRRTRTRTPPASPRWWRPTATGASSSSQSGKSRICYTLAQPKTRDPEDLKRDPAYAFISERPAERVRNEVSFIMGFEVGAPRPTSRRRTPRTRQGQNEAKSRKKKPKSVAPTAVDRRFRIRTAAQGQQPLGQERRARKAS